MKALVLGAGAGWSTKDVENGVVDGLRAAGVVVGRYAFEHRLATSADYLHYVHRRAKKVDPAAPTPTAADVQLHALVDVLPRALAHAVDWVVIVSGMFVPDAFLAVLQAAGVPVALVCTESPYQLAEETRWARQADLVWTHERSVLAAFAAVTRARYLPHAWRPGVHDAAPTVDVPAHDVVFVGTGFPERIAFLEAIDWTGIDLGLYGAWPVRRRSRLKPYVRASITDNATAAALYRRAKVGLNLYRETADWAGTTRITHAESLNPRAYELAAAGCFHLSTPRAEVWERFGALVPTCGTPAEASALLRMWLADAEGRAACAAALPARVADATWLARGRQMAADLAEALPAARARVVAMAQARAGSAVAA